MLVGYKAIADNYQKAIDEGKDTRFVDNYLIKKKVQCVKVSVYKRFVWRKI